MIQAAVANRVADAVVDRLKQISKRKDPSKWASDPKQYRRGMVVGDVRGELPAYFVQVGLWEGSIPNVSNELRTTARILIHCVSGDLSDDELAERTLNEMAEDAIKALREDVQFAGLVLYCGLNISYRPDGEAAQRSGKGIATLDVDFYWENPTTVL